MIKRPRKKKIGLTWREIITTKEDAFEYIDIMRNGEEESFFVYNQNQIINKIMKSAKAFPKVRGMTHEEIADFIGVSRETVTRAINAAKRSLI